MLQRAPKVPLMRLTALLCAMFAALAAAQEGREHFVPLFMSATDPDGRQGFLRIVNHSDRNGTVQLYGIDDAGERRGPVELSIDALETVHVNSNDIEDGNAAKGLSAGLGAGEGDWRLLLYGGGLDIEPLAYIRTLNDGFLTSMHDVVRETALRHRVPIFNPGSNDQQRSWLRLVNPGDAAASVAITGRDDTGSTSADRARVTIPAGAAVTLSAQDLEAGTGGVEGQLGDGAGKWSLDVAADRPVLVMSLMTLPTGHLSNLSGARPEYRGATGLWRIAFDDGVGGEGYVLLLPDSRMYAWLPESDTNRIARATYGVAEGTVSASGELFESGNIQLVGADVSGGSEAFDFTADYRSGDWIRGSYTAAGGSPRAFRGWAFTGFDRGGSTAAVAGLWSPTLGDDADLPGELEPGAGGDFDLEFSVEAIRCEADGVLAPVNPAFAVYEAAPAISCLVLQFPSGTVEMILAVMDSDGAPGGGDRALGLVVIPDERKIALGALFDLSRS